ncbi:MAG TPA: hypothetical protein VGI58_14750 [Streptosporangiaceae bacterium]|jgi:hypothetical protein
MDGDQRWYYCLKHHQVEGEDGCAGKDRLGPYPTREAAEHWQDTVRRRNEEWEAQDQWPGESPGQDKDA